MNIIYLSTVVVMVVVVNVSLVMHSESVSWSSLTMLMTVWGTSRMGSLGTKAHATNYTGTTVRLKF